MDEMNKSQITMILGICTLVSFCIPCLNYILPWPLFIITQGLGIWAHIEAKESGEDTTLAKVGMAIACVPFVLVAVLLVLYCFGVGGLVMLDNM